MRVIYGALWNFADEIENGCMTIEEASLLCKKMRDKQCKEAKEAGLQAKRYVLRGQKREYWRLGVPCDMSCTCYIADIY